MLYLQVIVGFILTGVFSTVSAVLLAAAHTEAVETLLDMMELIPDVVSTVFTLVGLILLWRGGRGGRLLPAHVRVVVGGGERFIAIGFCGVAEPPRGHWVAVAAPGDTAIIS